MTAPVLAAPSPAGLGDGDPLDALPPSMLDALVAAATPVDAPLLAPNPVNLITASRTNPDPAGTRWQDHGVAYTPEAAAALGAFGVCATPDDMADVTPWALPPARTWMPYVVWAGIACSTFGWQGVDWKGRLARLLDTATPKAVERELWTGEVAQAAGYDTANGNTWLARSGADGAVDVTGAAPVSVKRAFGALEQALADCGVGARGVIHCRPEAMPHFTSVRREGNVLLTPRDTIVVPGVGYPETGPTGAPATAGTTWLYATGRTDVRYDTPVFPVDPDAEADWRSRVIRRDVNTIVLLGAREAVASWDGVCHFAVHANLDL